MRGLKPFLLLLFVTSLSGYTVKKYKNNIFYVNFKNAPSLKEQDAILFKTGLKGRKAFLLNNGKIILHAQNTIYRYDASGKLEKSIELDFEPDIIIPSRDGKFVVIGKAMRKAKEYKLYTIDFKSPTKNLIVTLDSDHFPGVYSPIVKVKEVIKEDPSFKDDYFSHVYEYANFEGGVIQGNTLYIWYKPDHGLYFGTIYAISLKNGKLRVINDSIDHVCGSTFNTLFYTVLKDEDAAELDNAVYIYSRGKERRIPLPISISTVYCGGYNVATIKKDSLYVFNLKKKKVVVSSKIPGKDPYILGISKSGNRIFVVYEKNKTSALGVYDMRVKKITPIYTSGFPGPGNLTLSFDGEAFAFMHRDTLYIGYIEDKYPPFIGFTLPDSTHSNTVKVTIRAQDASFVSGMKGVYFNDKPISSDTSFIVGLKEGENTFEVKAEDRAHNIKAIKKTVIYTQNSGK